jgi:pseudouridine kinase
MPRGHVVREVAACVNCSSAAAVAATAALAHRGGEVAASVADVAAAAKLTPAIVQQHAKHIATAQLLILDANLQAATLAAAAHVAAAAGVPVLFEPVSIPKAAR